MATYKGKYISLKDAAVISGYTVSELRNFIKIGLISSKKIKNTLKVPFSAFEKINEDKKSKTATLKVSPKSNTQTAMIKKPETSIIPMPKPHEGLVSILQHTSLAAAMVFSLYIGMLPTVSEKIVFGVNLTYATIDQMSDAVMELTYSSVALPVELGSRLAQVAVLPSAEGYAVTGAVAGVSTSSVDQSVNLSESISNALIGIADASDSFEKTLDGLAIKTDEILIHSLNFENLDYGIQQFFKL